MMRNSLIAGMVLLLSGPTAAMAISNSAGPVAYISGGIGEGEQQLLRAHEGEYNLKLVFTLNEGNYIADVNVAVKDRAGKTVVEHVADGPFFLAKLPAGQYSVAATYDGKTVTRKFSVGTGGLRTEYFRWPADPQVDFAPSRAAK